MGGHAGAARASGSAISLPPASSNSCGDGPIIIRGQETDLKPALVDALREQQRPRQQYRRALCTFGCVGGTFNSSPILGTRHQHAAEGPGATAPPRPRRVLDRRVRALFADSSATAARFSAAVNGDGKGRRSRRAYFGNLTRRRSTRSDRCMCADARRAFYERCSSRP